MSTIESLDKVQQKTSAVALHMAQEFLKGKVPLLVIGAGVSRDLTIPEHLSGKVGTMGVPTILRYETTIERQLYRALNELMELRMLRKKYREINIITNEDEIRS